MIAKEICQVQQKMHALSSFSFPVSRFEHPHPRTRKNGEVSETVNEQHVVMVLRTQGMETPHGSYYQSSGGRNCASGSAASKEHCLGLD